MVYKGIPVFREGLCILKHKPCHKLQRVTGTESYWLTGSLILTLRGFFWFIIYHSLLIVFGIENCKQPIKGGLIYTYVVTDLVTYLNRLPHAGL